MYLQFPQGPSLSGASRPLASPRGAPAIRTDPGADAPARGTAQPDDFLAVESHGARPDDLPHQRVLRTLLAVYRAKYALDVGVAVFRDVASKAAEVRDWCDGLARGGCGYLLATTASGVHTFALAVARGLDGQARCLLVDSAGSCIHSVVAALEDRFDRRVYVTPRLQRTHERGCMVFALRFLLMTRRGDLARRIQQTLEDVDRQGDRPPDEARQLRLDDLWRLAGWLAATRRRHDLDPPHFLLTRPLANGGRHDGWTLAQYFERRPDDGALSLRGMYDEVDRIAHGLSAPPMPAGQRAYLEHRFLRHIRVEGPEPAPDEA